VTARWTVLERREFSKWGISPEDIVSAYIYVATLPVSFILNDGYAEERLKISELVSLSNPGTTKVTALTSLTRQLTPTAFKSTDSFDSEVRGVDLGRKQLFYICFDTKSAVQTCVANILIDLLQQAGWSRGTTKNAKADKHKAVALVLVSSGLPSNPTSLATIHTLRQVGVPMISVLSQGLFKKPDLASVLRGSSTSEAQDIIQVLAPGASNLDLACSLLAVYRNQPWRFNPQDTNLAMQVAFATIRERMNGVIGAEPPANELPAEIMKHPMLVLAAQEGNDAECAV